MIFHLHVFWRQKATYPGKTGYHHTHQPPPISDLFIHEFKGNGIP